MREATDHGLTEDEQFEAAAITAELDEHDAAFERVERGWQQVLAAMQQGELDLLEAATRAVELGLSEDEHGAIDYLHELQ